MALRVRQGVAARLGKGGKGVSSSSDLWLSVSKRYLAAIGIEDILRCVVRPDLANFTFIIRMVEVEVAGVMTIQTELLLRN